jgi:hypothetical protein
MPRDNHNSPVPRAPAAISGDDLLKQLARLLGRAAARQWVARERRLAPAAERQSEEKLDD